MAQSSAREAVQIGCLSLRLVAAILIGIVFLLAILVTFPLLLLVFLLIPFLFL